MNDAIRVRYRHASAGDAEAIAALHAESWRTNYRGAYGDAFLDGDVHDERLRVWRERLAQPRPEQFVWLAEDEGGLVGFVCAIGAEDPTWGTLLDNLHVLPRGQGAGIGARLVSAVGRFCLEAFPEHGIYLWVLEQNHHAQGFYRRMGGEDAEGGTFDAPGGGTFRSRRFVWRDPRDVVQVPDRG